MINKQDFIDQNEDVISEELNSSLSHIIPKLKKNGFFQSQLSYACAPGIVIEVQRRLHKKLYDHGWVAEIDFLSSITSSELHIKVY
ncbi:hypothetical protein [uncultured Photobacterium sp.]|uniref:hypothetical protein n=1 Tax=uncultured Photobacterium sp. TaxID=173973 RepID=UPI002604B388|nr:hypothetical protein [uncultured Photobacterium sp.]